MLASQDAILSRLEALEQKTSGMYVTSNYMFTLALLFLQDIKLKYLEPPPTNQLGATPTMTIHHLLTKHLNPGYR